MCVNIELVGHTEWHVQCTYASGLALKTMDVNVTKVKIIGNSKYVKYGDYNLYC